MNAADYGWLVLLSPLVGLALNMGIGSSVSRRVVAWIASLSILAGFVGSVLAFIDLLGRDDSQRQIVSVGWHWLSGGSFQVDASILVDPLSAVMLLVITGVGFLIHAYSAGYMHGDGEERRFFAYLNLFVFSMLLLVLAGNFVFLLAGWGLVGLSSYLLIGFWWQRPTAIAAAKKAFVMNAVGDVGMALGIFVIWNHVHSVDYATVFAAAPGQIGMGSHTANWIALLLLVAAVAKSAQLPLHTWLPDAMEGPTPVSALIHAATMVTAGVYLIARMWPLYGLAPDVSDLVALIGVATLTVAGLIALVQTDIKRVIAYSTMSQIGYMFCGVGIGAYSAGMFHLVTHAFFKALLFLGAGVVIHALHDEQDIRKMGGLSRYLPYTTGLMWIGSLALAGVPPFAGFFSKDQILSDALARGTWVGYTVWGLGLVGAFVTALYTFRLMLLVFHGEPSDYARRHGEAHKGHGEGPFSMLWTIGVLAVGALLAGLLEIPGTTHGMRNFLEPTIPAAVEATANQEFGTSALAVALALVGLFVAHAVWGRRTDTPRRLAAATAPLETVLQDKFGFDRLYDWAFYRPSVAVARGGQRLWEDAAVLGSMNTVSALGAYASRLLGSAQSGLVRVYALAIAVGIAALALWLITGASSSGTWTSTLLWLVPLGGALLCLVLPLGDRVRGGLALLTTLVTAGLAAAAALEFDPSGGTQYQQSHAWVRDIGLTYHVGMDGLSLVLVALAAVCVPCALGYGLWARRPNLRSYTALMLMLESSVVLLLVARDLALFYVGFESMLVPLALLIAVWGGPNRARAAIRFVIYTLVGSLLMLIGVITLGLRAGTFDLAGIGTSDSRWLFLAFMAAFAIKAPLYPFHGWVPEAYREAPPEVSGLLSGVVSKAGAYGMLRFALPLFPGPAHDLRRWFVAIAVIGLLWCSLMAFRQPDSRGVIAYSSISQMSLIGLGIFVMNDIGATGATFQMINHGLLSVLLFLIAGIVEVRTGDGLFRRIGALARGRAGLATVVMTVGIAALAVPGSSLFASEFLVLLGAFRDWWLIGTLASLAIVLAAMYMLRWISAVLHDAPADGPRDFSGVRDLRWEAAYLLPLVACVLALSVYPYFVTHRVADSMHGIVSAVTAKAAP